jgi:hypothetical protein
VTKEQISAAVEMLLVVSDLVIISTGENGCPSGQIYARLMGHINVDNYNLVISKLQKADLIRVENHFVTLTENGRKALPLAIERAKK